MYAGAVGDHKLKKQAVMMKGISKKMYDMQTIFFHFINNMWRFELGKTDHAWALMSPEEKKEFKIDVAQYDWEEGVFNEIFGLRRFYLKEDVLPPEAMF